MARRSVRFIILAVVAVGSLASLVESNMEGRAPRTLKPVRKAKLGDKPILGAVPSDLAAMDCKNQLTSCADCTNVLTCTKFGSIYRPLKTAVCPTSTPYCVAGQCVATLADDDACNNAPAYTTDFECIGDGYFPSPSDCTKYYMCVDGKAYQYDCSQYKNTVYSHAKAMCVPSTEVTCKAVTCTAATVGQYQLWSEDHSVYVVCTDTTAADAYVADCGEDMEIDSATGNCKRACHREGRLADGDSDTKYYECTQTATGTTPTYSSPVPKTCPGTSTFSKAQERCIAASSDNPDEPDNSTSTEYMEDYFAPRSDVSETLYNIPDGFLIGSASAAYQVEGAWNASQKSLSIQDVYFHSRPTKENGDVACDSYDKWKEDVQALKDLGMNSYRFSISWPRVLPGGDLGTESDPVGVQYYSDLIDELKLNNIEPIITMHHWDIPQEYQNDGGWLNTAIQDRFLDYADFLFKTYGDRVTKWVLMNEPHIFCSGGYETGSSAPGVSQLGSGAYECAHNMILAHAKAYRLYETNYKDTQKGMIGTSIDISYFQPATTKAEDVAAADRSTKFQLDWIASPLAYGEYPKIMRDTVDANSKAAGLAKSRLPEFTAEEKTLITGAWDFMGINHYTTSLVSAGAEPSTTASMTNDTFVTTSSRTTWNHSERYYFSACPWGMRYVLNYIKDNYNNMPVFITENGWAGPLNETLDDTPRVGYFSTYMRAVMRAINEDKCNVIGYTAWSLEDNLEWGDGFSARFGIVHVDFNDPERKRTLKTASAEFFSQIFKNKNVHYVQPSHY